MGVILAIVLLSIAVRQAFRIGAAHPDAVKAGAKVLRRLLRR
jgi:hypothetical protein